VQGGDGDSWVSAPVLGPALGGLAVLALFAWWETRVAHPSLDVRLFRDRRLSASVAAIALLFFGMGGVYFFTSFYLQNVRGYSPLTAGLLTVPFALGQFIMSPRSSRLVARFGAKAIGSAGMLLNALSIAMYALLGTNSPIAILVVAFLIQGAAIGMTMPAATAAVMDVLPRERAGAGSALTNTARQVAVALGVAVLGSILAETYRSHMGPTLAHLPAAASNVAGQSVSATQTVAQQLGHAGQFLLAPANVSFVDSMRITTIIAAGISVLGGLVVMRWMPGKPRPTMDETIEAEIAAAEQDLAQLSDR